MRCGCGECRERRWYTWFRYFVMDECGVWDEMSW